MLFCEILWKKTQLLSIGVILPIGENFDNPNMSLLSGLSDDLEGIILLRILYLQGSNEGSTWTKEVFIMVPRPFRSPLSLAVPYHVSISPWIVTWATVPKRTSQASLGNSDREKEEPNSCANQIESFVDFMEEKQAVQNRVMDVSSALASILYALGLAKKQSE